MTYEHWTKSVHHDGSPYYVMSNSLHLGSIVTLRLRTGIDAPVERVFLRTTPDGEQYMQGMRQVEVDRVSLWWEIELELRMLSTNYRFFLEASDGGYWLSSSGITRHTPTDATDFKIL